MIDPEVRRELSETGDDAGEVSRVLEWSRQPDFGSFSSLPSRRARLERLIDLYAEIKGPVLSRLREEPGVVVDDLKSLPQAIVRASPGRWRELVAEGGFLDLEPSVRVLPETTAYAVNAAGAGAHAGR